ncbi:hypothetical protein ACLOJK_020297 [Asimina triloba]
MQWWGCCHVQSSLMLWVVGLLPCAVEHGRKMSVDGLLLAGASVGSWCVDGVMGEGGRELVTGRDAIFADGWLDLPDARGWSDGVVLWKGGADRRALAVGIGDGLCSGVAARRMEAVDGEDDGDAVGGKAGQLAVPSCGLLMGWRDGSSGGGMVAAGSRMWVADRI